MYIHIIYIYIYIYTYVDVYVMKYIYIYIHMCLCVLHLDGSKNLWSANATSFLLLEQNHIQSRDVSSFGNEVLQNLLELTLPVLQFAASYYIYITYIPMPTSGGTKFMLLESFTKHPFRSTTDHIFKSVLCGRCGTVNYHPLLNI